MKLLPHISRDHLARILRERRPTILSGLVCTLLFFLGWNLIPQIGLPEYPFQELLPYLCMTASALAMIGLVWWRKAKDSQEAPQLYTQLTHVFALGVGLSVVAIWGKLEFGPSGVVGDSFFSASIIAKYKEFWGNTDFIYQDLHSFYPSLYHYLLGKLAWLTGAEPWTMLNTGMLLTVFFLPLGIFAMWKRLTDDRIAFIFTVFTVFVARDEILFKPFEIISLSIFLPWLLRYIWAAPGTLGNGAMRQGGIIGGLLFMTYYYYFFLLVAFIPLRLLVGYRNAGSWNGPRKLLRQYWKILRWIPLVSVLYWAPLLFDFVRFGLESFQNRWFQPYMITGPYDNPNAWPIVAGLLVAVGLAMKFRLAKGFVLILVAQLLWLLLAFLLMLAETPLLYIRMIGIEVYIAWFSLGWGILLLGDQYLKGGDLARLRPLLPVTMAVIFGLYLAQDFHRDKQHEFYKIAARSEMPALVYFPEFQKMAKGKVFLTGRYDICAYRPIYQFIAHNAHFSHPAGRFRDRLKFLLLLSQSKNPDFVAYMLRHNQFGQVDYLILDDNRMKVYDDNFPNREAHTEVIIQFAPEALEGRWLARDTTFPEMIIVQENVAGVEFSPQERAMAAWFGDETLKKIILPERILKSMKMMCMKERPEDYNAWAKEAWEQVGK